MIVDDHAIIRDGLQMMIDAQSDMVVVGSVADGTKAIGMARRLSPDVVIMDISMPGLNGLEASAHILEMTPETGIIILSMHINSDYIYRALEVGVLGYLLKDSAGAEVLDAIRTVSNGQRFLSPQITDMLADDYVATRRRAQTSNPLDLLSPREISVLRRIAEGHSNQETALELGISVKTVETYRSRLMSKLSLKDRTGLVNFALQHGLLKPAE
jgi:DNA-binding NarL/FixJ family response regulator